MRFRRALTCGALSGVIVLCTPGVLRGQGPTLRLSERTATVNGGSLYYRIGGNGPPLLLIHGFTFTGHEWDLFLDDLGARHTLIVPDLPGHGRSTDVSGEFRYGDVAARLFSLLDELGIGRFSGVGQSAGASLLVHMALQQPSRVDAMVLVAGAHRLAEAGRRLLRGLQLEDMPDELVDYYRHYHPGGEAQARSLFARLRALADNYDDLGLPPERLATIGARTLLVWGDRDEAYPVEVALEMYRAIPNAMLWVVPDQGHYPIWEWLGGSKEAEEMFPSVVLDFLARPDR